MTARTAGTLPSSWGAADAFPEMERLRVSVSSGWAWRLVKRRQWAEQHKRADYLLAAGLHAHAMRAAAILKPVL
jgi:hypothetical protein